MICSLPRAQVERFIQYVFVKIHSDKIPNFMDLANSIYKETSEGNNANSLSYLQMLPSVYVNLYSIRKEVRDAVPAEQLAIAGPKIDQWANLDNVKKDLGLDKKPVLNEAKMFVDTWKDLSIRAFNRIYQKSTYVVEGLQADAALRSKNYNKDISIEVTRFPITNLKTQYIPLIDTNGKPIGDLQFAAQHPEFYVTFKYDNGIMGYIKPLKYYRSGKEITLDELASIVEINESDLQEMKAMQPLYDALFSRLKEALGDKPSTKLTLNEAGIVLTPNFNKFDILSDTEFSSKQRAAASASTTLDSASEFYSNNGKGLIVKAYDGQYISEVTDDEAPELPIYKDAQGNVKAFRGYFALVTMPNNKKYWVGIRPTNLDKLGTDELNNFVNSVNVARERLKGLTGNTPDNNIIADTVANDLNNAYYTFTGTDYNVFFTTNFNALKNTYVLRADFLLRNMPIGNKVPTFYFDDPVADLPDLIKKMNTAAVESGLSLELTKDSFRKNIPFDRVSGQFEKLSQEKLGKSFSTTVGTNIFYNAFFTFSIKDQAELSQKIEEVENEEEVKPLTPAEVIANMSPEFLESIKQQALEEQKRAAAFGNGSSPFKITNKDNLKPIDQKELDELKKMLPSYISVQDLETLVDKLNVKGIPLGYFKDKVIYLAAATEKGVPYHEAFHAIFRTALSDSEINDYLDKGRKALLKANPTALNPIAVSEFKYNRNYTDLTNEEVESIIIEEYLADKFQEYKLGKKDSLLSRLYEKLLNFVRWLTNRNTDIESLFYKMSSGKFTGATYKMNKFNNIGYGVYDLIPNTSGLSESEAIIKTVAARVVEDFGSYAGDMDAILNDMAKFYAIENPENRQGILDQKIDVNKLVKKFAIYSDPDTRNIIKSEVSKLLNKLYKYNPENDEFQSIEEEFGRGSEGVWDRSIDEFGGFDGVNAEIKRFVLTTTYMTVDPVTGRKVRSVIDGEYVYANLERALAGRKPADIIMGLQALAKINPQIKAVWDKLKAKTNLIESTPETVGNESSFTDLDPANYSDNLEGKQFMITFLKALEKNFLNHLQVVVDYSGDNNNKSRVFSSNRQDAPEIQMQRWQQNYLGYVYERLVENTTLRAAISDSIKTFVRTYNSGKVTDEDLEKVRKALWDTGLEFEPAYIRMSFASKDDAVASSLRKAFPETARLNTLFLNKVAEYLDLNKILFEKGDLTTDKAADGAIVDLGLTSMIKQYVTGNVIFDSRIFQTNFQTADNKTRYSYVYPNYYVNKINEIKNKLSSVESVKGLQENTYFKFNHLFNIYSNKELNAQLVAANFGNLNVEITGDIREEETDEEGVAKMDSGLVFKDTDEKALLITNLALFANRTTKTVSTLVDGKRMSHKLTFARFWPIQLEAKSTMLSVNLPVLDGISKEGDLTTAGEAYLRNYISQEIARIGILTKPMNERNKDYKIDNKRNEFVYFKFLNNRLVDGILEIKRDAKGNVISRKPKVTSEDIQLIVNEAKKALRSEYEAFLDRVSSNNIMSLIDKKSEKDYNTKANFLSAYFYNHLFNSIGIKQLMFGDESQFKDDVDLVKRAGGLLAFGVSRGERVYTTAYTTEAIEYIYAESMEDGSPDTRRVTRFENETAVEFQKRIKTGISDGSIIEINTDDAGSEMTAQEFIDIQYDLGRLNPMKLEALNLLKEGIKPNSPEEERYNYLINNIAKTKGGESAIAQALAIDAVSMKLVSFGGGFLDGTYTDTHNVYYDKMSVAVLFKNFTSRWDEATQKWVPQKGLEALHNKRVWMEKNGIGQVNPKSAGKLKTGPLMDHRMFRGVVLDEEAPLPEAMSYTPQKRAGKNQRLQVEVESHGYSKITALSQATQLIDTEVSDAMLPLREEYQKTLAEIRQRSFIEAYDLVSKDIVIDNKESRDIKLFLEKVRDIISSTTPSMSMLEYLETEGVDTKYDFNVPSVISKLENVFLAHFNNDTFVQKVPGRTFVLRSSRDYKIIVNSTNGKIITRDQYVRAKDPSLYETDRYETRELRVHKKVGDKIQYAEVVMTRGTAALHGLKIGDQIPEDLLIAFGVRIPSQSHHSMIPFKVVDFLPDYMGDTIIVPKEIVYLSGADFDIDKLFVYMKAFYTKGKGVVAYGKASSPEERKAEYEKWELKNNSTLKRLIDNIKENSGLDALRREKKELEQALSLGPLFNAFDSLVEALVDTKENKSGIFKEFYDNLESSIAYVHGEKAESKKQVVSYLLDRINSLAERIADVERSAKDEAMAYLKFPTLEDFKKDPNLVSKGALYNKLIDIHVKFATNVEDTVVESLRTPATTKLLEQDANLLSRLTGKSEGRFIGSSINGIVDSWVNNAQGKRLVGIWANTNIVNASLTKYKVKLKQAYGVMFDGVWYVDFAKEREDDVLFNEDGSYRVVSEVRRKADTISGGVSAATDNAKERLMARLNYDDDNTGVYGIMNSLGMGRTRTNLFASQPVIVEYNKSLKGAQTQIRASGSKTRALEIKISGLKKAISEALAADKKQVTRQMFEELEFANITSDKLVASIEGKLTGLDKLMHEYSVLNAFKRMKDVQEYGRKYARLLSINRGITSNFSYVNDLLEEAYELDLGDLVERDRLSTRDRLNLPFNVRDHIVPTVGKVVDLNIYNNIKNIKSIDKISKKFFIKNTEWFKSTLGNISNSTVNFPGGITGKNFRQYTEKALFNFVVMTTYSKWLKDVKGINIENFAPLAYNNLGSETIRDKFTELLKEKEFSSNELVRFIQTDKRNIVDRIFTNTRLKTTAKTEQRFVDAYDALLNSKNPKIREFAIGLFGYILVKDGGMFGNSSIVKFIKPAMFYNMAAALRGVNRAMYKSDNELAKQITGYDLNELRGRFYKTYVSDFNVYPYLKKLPKEDITDATGVVIGERFATSVKGYSKKGEFDVYKITKGKDSVVIKTAPIRGGGSMGKSEFMHYVVDSNDDVKINPPKAITASMDGKRELFLLSKAEASKDSSGYVTYTYTYKTGTVFGTRDYNPYTLPYDFSVSKFNFGAPVKKADTRAMSIAEVNDLLSQSDIIEDMYTAEPITKTSMENTLPSEEKSVSYNIKTYEGKITKLKDNEVFVFGSNPEGRHGAGAAKQAMSFGAKYGQGRGPQGKTYGLVTKNLKAGYVEPSTGIKYNIEGERSVPMELIESNIKELYDYADQNPDKSFLVIYSGAGKNLNGYSNQEMARAFSKFPIPINMVFEKSFSDLLTPIIDVKNTTVGEQIISEQNQSDPKTIGRVEKSVSRSTEPLHKSVGGIRRSFLINFPKHDSNTIVPETVELPDFVEEYIDETSSELSFPELQYMIDYEAAAREFMDAYLVASVDGQTMQEFAELLTKLPENALEPIDDKALLGEELYNKFRYVTTRNRLELYIHMKPLDLTFAEKQLLDDIIFSQTSYNPNQLSLWATENNESETPFDC